MEDKIINYDPAYNTVDRDNFEALVEVDRYADRSGHFDQIISGTAEHFWDPQDPRYVDYDKDPFDLENETLMPREFCIELGTAVADKLNEKQKIRLANQSTRFILSTILHGEQGALSLSAALTSVLRDPGAPRNMPPTRPEKKPDMSPGSQNILSHAGAPPSPQGPRFEICSVRLFNRVSSTRNLSACNS